MFSFLYQSAKQALENIRYNGDFSFSPEYKYKQFTRVSLEGPKGLCLSESCNWRPSFPGQFGNSEEYYSTSSTTCQRHENHAAPSERIVVLALPATSSPQWKELKQRKPRQPRIKSKKIEIHEQDNKQKSPPFTFMFTEWQGRQKRDTNRVRRMIKRVSSDMHDVYEI
ncbi:uncharacterized protein LOC100251835 isoform X3 [Vitis vinifera]|uniref:uncharacterized protein LOC100251835 isoform X3 n=1 Tax=Vitis vinifera TaxID=29760 RepID=UPI002882EBBA|nr:uncharacterized protein LOC100251835 isoform X3 [Vitis vinifera]